MEQGEPGLANTKKEEPRFNAGPREGLIENRRTENIGIS